MAGQRSKEFMKKYQARLEQAQRVEPSARTQPVARVLTRTQQALNRHDELIRRHTPQPPPTPPIANAVPLDVPGVDPLFVERLRERAYQAAEREARRLVRAREEEARVAERRRREEEARQRDTEDSFATGRKVELDDES